MKLKDTKGSITIFVLIGLLFMAAFLMISYGYNVNKSKMAKERFDSISDIYSHKDGDENAYNRAYTALRNKNKQTLVYNSENEGIIGASEIELTKTYADKINNYKIYGDIVGVGNLITDVTNANYGKYEIPIKISNQESSVTSTYSVYVSSQLYQNDYIDYKEQKVIKITGDEEIELPELSTYEDYTKIEVLTTIAPSRIEIEYTGYTLE